LIEHGHDLIDIGKMASDRLLDEVGAVPHPEESADPRAPPFNGEVGRVELVGFDNSRGRHGCGRGYIISPLLDIRGSATRLGQFQTTPR
jgi:hypothetical protein